jgi:hypothetical protein
MAGAADCARRRNGSLSLSIARRSSVPRTAASRAAFADDDGVVAVRFASRSDDRLAHSLVASEAEAREADQHHRPG